MLTTSLPHDGDPSAGAFVREMAVALARRGVRVTLLGSVPRGRLALAADGVRVDSVEDLDDGVFAGGGAPGAPRRWAPGISPAAWAQGRPHRPPRWACSRRATRGRSTGGSATSRSRRRSSPGRCAGRVRTSRSSTAPTGGCSPAFRRRCGGWCSRARRVAVYLGRYAVGGRRGCASAAAGGGRPDGLLAAGGRRVARDVVVSVGRLVAVKRVDRALAAMAELEAQGRGLPWVVLGDGPERAALEAAASARGLDVRFEGSVDAAERDAWLRRARVFLHTAGGPSGAGAEGAPVALLEAMGAGAAVVATASGGVRWMVGETGTVLDGDADAAAIADGGRGGVGRRTPRGSARGEGAGAALAVGGSGRGHRAGAVGVSDGPRPGFAQRASRAVGRRPRSARSQRRRRGLGAPPASATQTSMGGAMDSRVELDRRVRSGDSGRGGPPTPARRRRWNQGRTTA